MLKLLFYSSYASFKAAVDATETEGTVELLSNCSTEHIKLENKDIKIILNGYTLSTDGSDNYGRVFDLKGKKVKLTVDGTKSGSRVKGTIMCAADTIGVIIVDGGTYEGVSYCPFYINGLAAEETATPRRSSLTVTNAAIIAATDGQDAEGEHGIYLAGPSDTTLKNCIIKAGNTGIEIRAGKVDIINCIITGSGSYGNGPNGNGATVNGAAVAVSQHQRGDGYTPEYPDVEVTIKGDETTLDGEKQLVVINTLKESSRENEKNVKVIVEDIGLDSSKVIGFTFDKKTYYPTFEAAADTSWYDNKTTENSYTLNTAQELAGLACLVNAGNTFEGKTIKLGNDIDLNKVQWTPIGLYHDEIDTTNFEKRPFKGIFDGQKHTVSNLKIDLDNGYSSYRALFGYVAGVTGETNETGKVSNLTVEGEVKANSSSGVVAALGDGGTVENVKNYVNVSVTNGADANKIHSKIAGVVVAVKGTETCTINNCENHGKIESTVSTADDAVGGILAWSEVNSLTVSGCKNYGEIKAAETKQNAGGIIGAIWTTNSSGTYSITNCSNEATITCGTGTVAYAGEIIGRSLKTLTVQNITGCSTTENYKLVGNLDITD